MNNSSLMLQHTNSYAYNGSYSQLNNFAVPNYFQNHNNTSVCDGSTARLNNIVNEVGTCGAEMPPPLPKKKG